MLKTCEKVGVDYPPFFFYTDDMNYKALLYALVTGITPVALGIGIGYLIMNAPMWLLLSLVGLGYAGYLFYLYRSYDKQLQSDEK